MGVVVTLDSREYRRCCDEWEAMLRTGLTLSALQVFYARYKYLIMSRHIASYRAIGPLLAGAEKQALEVVAQRVFELIKGALVLPASRSGDANALLHICGYLKKQLQPDEKRVLLDAIEKYRVGEIEFAVPAALLREHFQRFPNSYIEQQVFLRLDNSY